VTYAKSAFTKCTDDSYHEARTQRIMAREVVELKAPECVNLMVGPYNQERVTNAFTLTAQRAEVKKRFVAMHDCVVRGLLWATQGILLRGKIQGQGSIMISGSAVLGRGLTRNSPDARERGTEINERVMDHLNMLTEQRNEKPEDRLIDQAAPLYEAEEVAHEATPRTVYAKSRNLEQYGTEKFLFLLPDSVNETEFGGAFALDNYYNRLREEDEGPFPGKTRWREDCCVIPKSAYEDVKPYTVDGENEVEEYELPELESAVEAYPAIVVV